MSFGGSVAAMIQSLKNNKRERITAFDKKYETPISNYKKLEDHKKMSAEDFEVFKQQLQVKEKKRQQKLYLVFGSIMAVLLGIGIYFLFFY